MKAASSCYPTKEKKSKYWSKKKIHKKTCIFLFPSSQFFSFFCAQKNFFSAEKRRRKNIKKCEYIFSSGFLPSSSSPHHHRSRRRFSWLSWASPKKTLLTWYQVCEKNVEATSNMHRKKQKIIFWTHFMFVCVHICKNILGMGYHRLYGLLFWKKAILIWKIWHDDVTCPKKYF